MIRRNTRLVKIVRKIWEQLEVSLVLEGGLNFFGKFNDETSIKKIGSGKLREGLLIAMCEKDFLKIKELSSRQCKLPRRCKIAHRLM